MSAPYMRQSGGKQKSARWIHFASSRHVTSDLVVRPWGQRVSSSACPFTRASVRAFWAVSSGFAFGVVQVSVHVRIRFRVRVPVGVHFSRFPLLGFAALVLSSLLLRSTPCCLCARFSVLNSRHFIMIPLRPTHRPHKSRIIPPRNHCAPACSSPILFYTTCSPVSLIFPLALSLSLSLSNLI